MSLPKLNPCKVAYVLISWVPSAADSRNFPHQNTIGYPEDIEGVFSTRDLAYKHASKFPTTYNWRLREFQVDIGS